MTKKTAKKKPAAKVKARKKPLHKSAPTTSKWSLADGDARAAEYPDTFHMPPIEDRRRLRVGDLVKLCFEVDDPPGGERMWVRVTETSASIPRRYVGALESSPYVIPLVYGALIAFGPEHVIDIVDVSAEGADS